MYLSPLGKTRLTAHVIIFLINILVLVYSARVNIFQEYFFVADLFPFALSIVTLLVFTLSIFLDFAVHDPFTARAPFEIGSLTVLSIFWLSFNAFSTSRWRYVPKICTSIPNNYPAEITWCENIQILKSLIWIEWSLFFVTSLFILRYAVTQSNLGNTHVWNISLSRYTRRDRGADYLRRDPDFLTFEKPY